MKYSIKITVGIMSAITLFSCGSKTSSAVQDKPAVPVVVAKALPNGTAPYLAVSGTLQAAKSTTLSTRIMGYVTKTLANTGDRVEKGAVLLRLQNADLEAKLAQVQAGITEAKVAFVNAEKDFQRFKSLVESKSATQKEFDDMTTRYQMAKARLEAAQYLKKEVESQFEYTHIKAPFSGVVTSRTISEGDLAKPGVPLFTLEAPNEFEVITRVPETQISKIKVDQEVAVFVKAIHASLKGKVVEVSPSAIHSGGQFLVKISVQKSELAIRSGMFVNVQFPVGRFQVTSPVYIPKSAIVTQGQLQGVYTVSQQNTALLRWLRLGKTQGTSVEVLSGLADGESYIVAAEGKLYNGVSITVQQD